MPRACPPGCGDPHLRDHLGEENAAGADPRIGDAAGAEQSFAQRRFSRDIRVRRAGFHGDADKRARQVGAAVGRYGALYREILKRLLGEDHNIGALAAP